MNSVMTFRDVTVSYKRAPAIWGIDCDIPAGSFVGIVGPNGSGKSTLLKACVGLLPLSSGEIRYFNGEELSNVRKRIAYLPQRESIDWDFPINVLNVVLMGTYPRLGFFRKPSREDKRLAELCLDKVGMLEFKTRQISELSGGQQQRVFLARALAQQAELYLLDEPFSAVDAKTEAKIIEVINDLKKQGKSIVVVHHDLFSVVQNTDKVLLLNTRLVHFGDTQDCMQRKYLEECYGGQLESFANVLFETSRR